MATKFYLPFGGATPTPAPAVGSQWTVTPAGFSRGITLTTKQNTTVAADASPNFGETSASLVNVIHRQFVSQPLAAQTISGTFAAVVSGGEDASTNDSSLQVVVRVVSDDGATERGVLYAGHAATLNTTVGALGQELATSTQSRLIPSGTTLSSVVCVGGDRLIIEVGVRHHSTLTTNATDWLTFGDATATADHAQTAGVTTTLCPSVTFSATIALAGVTDPVGITDSAAFFAGAPVAKAPADPVGITDTVASAYTANRTAADPVGVTDSVSVFAGAPLASAPADPVGITDSLGVTMNAVVISQLPGFVGWGIPIG